MKIVAFLSLWLSLVSACARPEMHKHSENDVACSAAEAMVEEIVENQSKRPVVFSTEPEDLTLDIDGRTWTNWEDGRPTEQPPTVLISKLRATKGVSAVEACASVRAILIKHRVEFGSKAVEAATKLNGLTTFRVIIEGISLPAVSANGNEALVATHVESGLAGGGYVKYLRLSPGREWRVVGTTMLGIS